MTYHDIRKNMTKEEYDAATKGSFETSPQQRLDRSVYLTYIEQGKKFRHVTREEFRKKLWGRLDHVNTSVSTQDHNVRICDVKDTWYSRLGVILGETWRSGELYSHWINEDAE